MFNAFHYGPANSILILPEVLVPPIFDISQSDATYYAAAYIFAHEICHAFDSGGSRYDEVGVKRDWWTPEDKAAFNQKQQQLITLWGQLEAYPGQPADGEATLRENMADYGGMTLAFEAYKRRLKARGFSGQQYDEQLRKFFLSYGYPVALNSNERSLDALKERYLNDSHSVGHNRVNGILRLIDEWYRVYDVKPSDKLYVAPEERVRIW